MRFLRVFNRGLHRFRTDKEFARKVLAKYTRVTDPETLSNLHQIFGGLYTGDQIPYVRSDGVTEILKTIDLEGSRLRPNDFVDDSLLSALEKEGLFRSLYR